MKKQTKFSLVKLVPYEVWWILVGLNYGLSLFGIFLGNYSLLFLGLVSAISCSLSAFVWKKMSEGD